MREDTPIYIGSLQTPPNFVRLHLRLKKCLCELLTSYCTGPCPSPCHIRKCQRQPFASASELFRPAAWPRAAARLCLFVCHVARGRSFVGGVGGGRQRHSARRAATSAAARTSCTRSDAGRVRPLVSLCPAPNMGSRLGARPTRAPRPRSFTCLFTVYVIHGGWGAISLNVVLRGSVLDHLSSVVSRQPSAGL